MKLVVDSGTGTAAKISGRDVAGKTGTTEMEGTSGNRDAWFAGYTSDYVMVTWMGFDKSDQQHYLRQGSELPASMFSKVMSQGLAGTKSKSFDTSVQEKAPDDKDKTKDKPKEADTIVNDLAASFDGNKSVQVNWSPVKAEGVKYFLYRADKNPDGTAVNSIPLGQYSKPGYTDGSVVAGKSYWYSVVVWKDGQELSKSNFASVTIPGGKTEPPKDPNQPTQPGNGGATQPGGTGGGTNTGGGTQQPGTPTNPNQPGTPDTGGGTQPPNGGGTTQPGNGTGNIQGTGGTTPPGSGGQPSIPVPPPTQ
jgi:penicillin-binding protein 2A